MSSILLILKIDNISYIVRYYQMTFKQNYFNELPNDIQEKISIIVNKSRFNNCLKDIDLRNIFQNAVNEKIIQ